ncbi:MAG TPA: hypothetical protein VM581_04675 [Magnetospirillaceae bacterium]|nr:hypothetical protein [Magnetospirillaceae bacterium]
MAYTSTQALTSKRVGSNKLILGFLAAVISVVVGTTGVAQAAPAGKPTKEQCAAAGFKNYGQCVALWAKTHGGGGYGGNTTINIDLDLTVIGNNNTIIIRLWG